MARFLFSLAIVVFIFAGCENAKTMTDNMTIEVGIITLQEQPITVEQELSGRVKSPIIAEIRPEVNGIIKKVVFKEGQKIKKGDLLYDINSDAYQSLYDSASAALQSAEANFEAVSVKKSRYDELIKFEGISKQDHDDIKALYLQAKALVSEKKAALRKTEIDLQKTKITAPISGVIGISSVTEGALVTAMQQEPLTTIRHTNTMYVDLLQSSNQLLALKETLGDKNVKKGSATVKLKLLNDAIYQHEGVLKLQEIAVDESTSMVTLRAEFPNPEGILLSGMYVRAILEQAVNTHSFLVPQRAVSRDSRGNPIITVVTEENGTQTKIISTQRVIEDKWLVTEGVSSKDKIIIEGLNRINSRSKVTFIDVTDKYINRADTK